MTPLSYHPHEKLHHRPLSSDSNVMPTDASAFAKSTDEAPVFGGKQSLDPPLFSDSNVMPTDASASVSALVDGDQVVGGKMDPTVALLGDGGLE
jgi:hypothetical protein